MNRLSRLALIGFLAVALMLGLPDALPMREAQAQWDGDIDSVIESLDQDFSFGGKEDVKRSNIQRSNEQNQEDIKIQEEEAIAAAAANTPAPANTTTVVFTSTELGSPNGTDFLKVIFAGAVIADGLDGSSVTRNVTVAKGSTQTLSVTCQAALSVSCDFVVDIISGGTFSGGGASTGTQMLSASGAITFSVLVS